MEKRLTISLLHVNVKLPSPMSLRSLTFLPASVWKVDLTWLQECCSTEFHRPMTLRMQVFALNSACALVSKFW